ncbi:metal ABC transporter solute-binding protein, Zn/Mn family [Caproiciproducens sp. MSJ-32]|uniref:metal ABC transporter solute-binding protein, Zn/Mn family n=1 Tax=Caproiciproducens sp. MSJ-32 TaxID=2841527 RepID=UPI001C11A2FA|nr:zinc ABC transporter substrate-binding protein [Caproiciproducens sp. MSJ-32]MBU5454371.1 zinc ABC transporter substrate-binding protein [Caproiciproducens sp. MSJ-32]
MKKLTYILIIFTFSLFLFLNISGNSLEATMNSEEEIQQNEKLDIVAINEHQYRMIMSLVKDKHNVDYLVKNNEELKDYKIDDTILESVLNNDLLIYSDLENKDFIDKINEGRKRLRDKERNNIDKKIRSINIARGIYPMSMQADSKEEANPYYYLGINEYKIALYNTKMALQENDIANRDYYEKNYNDIIKEIENFIKETAPALEKVKEYKILAASNKFDYFFKNLGIEVVKVNKDNINEYLEEEKVIFIHDLKEENILPSESKIKVLELNFQDSSIEGIKNNINKLIEFLINS